MSSIVVDEASSTDAPITDEQELTQEITQEAQAEETPQPESTIPEKFAGKSTEELVEMYQNVEKMMGKQASEVGEQRKLIQSLMESQNRAAEATPNVEETTLRSSKGAQIHQIRAGLRRRAPGKPFVQ